MGNIEENIKRVREEAPSTNCIGAALFMVGEQSTPKAVDPFDAYYDFLEYLHQIPNSQEGCLISWEIKDGIFQRKVCHLGVVTNTFPLLITNKRETDGPLKENESFDSVNSVYGSKRIEVRYYLPRNHSLPLAS